MKRAGVPTGRRSRLRLRDLVGEAGAAIGRRPGRSLLTTLGTVVGVGAFVATTGLASTARAQVGETFDALKATEVRVTDAAPGSDEIVGGEGLQRMMEHQARTRLRHGLRVAGFGSAGAGQSGPLGLASPVVALANK